MAGAGPAAPLLCKKPTPGTKLSAAKRRLKLGKVFKVGLNDWYIAAGKPVDGVLKVRHGLIQEIGVANRRFLSGRSAQRHFLTSFTAG